MLGRIGPLASGGGRTSLRASVSSSDSFDGRSRNLLDHNVVGLLGSDIATSPTVKHDKEAILGKVLLLLVESLSVLLLQFVVLPFLLLG